MVAPVVGPTTVTTQRVVAGIFYDYDRRIRYKQKPPFTLNLPYIRQVGTLERVKNNNGYGSIRWDADALPTGTLTNAIYIRLNNLSYERLRKKMYATAGVGVDLVEYKQSVRMINSTALTLVNFSRKLKRGDFVGAAEVLRMKYLPKGVSKAKSFGNNFLEYHFGWSPLIRDIYDAAEVLNDPKRWFGIEYGSAREPLFLSTDNKYHDSGSVISTGFGSGYVEVKQGARIRGVKNYTTHTLEALGLTNPASLVWEVVPFSFVVDWFVNVGDYLRSYTDFTGLSIDSTFTTAFYRFGAGGKNYRKVDMRPGIEWYTSYVYMERTTSLTGTTLSTKRMTAPSAVRAATAISLLLQQLR